MSGDPSTVVPLEEESVLWKEKCVRQLWVVSCWEG